MYQTLQEKRQLPYTDEQGKERMKEFLYSIQLLDGKVDSVRTINKTEKGLQAGVLVERNSDCFAYFEKKLNKTN